MVKDFKKISLYNYMIRFFKMLAVPDDKIFLMQITAKNILSFLIKFLQKEKNLKSFDLTSHVR